MAKSKIKTAAVSNHVKTPHMEPSTAPEVHIIRLALCDHLPFSVSPRKDARIEAISSGDESKTQLKPPPENKTESQIT